MNKATTDWERMYRESQKETERLEKELAEIKASAYEPAAKCHEGQCKHYTYKLHLRGVRSEIEYLTGIIHDLKNENERLKSELVGLLFKD